MKLIPRKYDTRTQIRAVADLWAERYSGSHWSKDAEKQSIYNQLLELDVETATPEDVSKIIGNSCWVVPIVCDECSKAVDYYVQFGEDDFETGSSTTTLCLNCLKNATAMIEAKYQTGN